MSSSTSPDFSRAGDHALIHSSPESEQPVFDTNAKTAKEGLSNSFYRADGPYLCSLPEASAVLRKYSQTTADYHALVKEIHTLQDAITKVLQKGVSVESIDPTMEVLPRCSPIQPSDSIELKWPSIRDRILEEVRTSEWTRMSLCRYGRDKDPLQNPITIIVSVCHESTRVFHADRKKIWAICADHGERNVSIRFKKEALECATASIGSLCRDCASRESRRAQRVPQSLGRTEPTVGMLMGGSERMNTFVFTEIGDLMHDIQVVTGALESGLSGLIMPGD
ncbi:hypothetical protein BO78DRAFT_472315 [Aspergillus sclerotiicarbonarius CBS 121057]|uniref:Uncharacterized protein n=1 Tax=Aspergillus sclerotiicarbonarius (strain CBS 121057 / IBT 28362) TaxID=1448318 RepID=A0A319DYY0_ASPSB|nr:hypothetical protein BO78DRAFT_472315 [Aspergillus sclerotiicarbonarius CBS 121057]